MKKLLFSLVFPAVVLGSCSSQQEQPTHVSAGETTAPEVHLLDAKSFSRKLDTAKNVQLVDVRTPEEFSGGYISGAVNMNVNAPGFKEQVTTLDKSKPVMVYCKGGGRSGRAAEILKNEGFTQVYDLDGGIMAWQGQELPLAQAQAHDPSADRYTPRDFDRLLQQPLVLVDFYATWCAPCKKMEPVLEKINNEYKGSIVVQRINVDEAVALCKQLKVEALPVVCLYKNGTEIKRVKGEQNETQLRALVSELLK